MINRAFSAWKRLLGLGKVKEPNPEDRRNAGRSPTNMETVCQKTTPEHGSWVKTHVRNLSTQGACLHVPCDFSPGQLISLVLPCKEEGDHFEVLCCVVRCVSRGANEWEVGITFAAEMDEQDLQYVLAGDASVIEEEDQRNWIRFPCRAEAAYQVVRDEEGSPNWLQAKLLNISGGGMAMKVTERLLVGDLLSVELRRKGQPILTALASIVRTEDHKGEHFVGCNFIRSLPTDQLNLLTQ